MSPEVIAKDDSRIVALGSLDEASSLLGLLVAQFKKDCQAYDWEWEIELVSWLQDKLYTISALTARLGNRQPDNKKLPVLKREDVEFLEKHIE